MNPIINVTVAAAKYLASGCDTRTKEEYIACLNQCNACEHLHPLIKGCRVCCCLVQIKAAMKTEHCPINKW